MRHVTRDHRAERVADDGEGAARGDRFDLVADSVGDLSRRAETLTGGALRPGEIEIDAPPRAISCPVLQGKEDAVIDAEPVDRDERDARAVFSRDHRGWRAPDFQPSAGATCVANDSTMRRLNSTPSGVGMGMASKTEPAWRSIGVRPVSGCRTRRVAAVPSQHG